MGMAGATVALPSGAESLFWNPAGISEINPSEIWGSYGSGGNFGPADIDGAFGLGSLDWGNLALGVSDQQFPGVSGLQLDRYILGVSLPISDSVWIGTNQKYFNASPGGLEGWSMDLGLQAALGDSFRLGLDATDVLSELSWEGGLEEEQPTTLAAGAAWSPWHGTWLSGEYDGIEGSDSSNLEWRAGIESAWLGRLIVLRLGATQISGSSDFLGTGGLGSGFQIRGTRFSLNYAYVDALNSDSISGSRNLLSLSLEFGVAPALATQAYVSKLLKDPKTGKVFRARIDLIPEAEDVSDWSLEIRDRKGKTVKTFSGHGPLPPSISWDGSNENGVPVAADGLVYSLRTKSPSGARSERRSSLAPQAGPTSSGFGEILDSGSEGTEFGLRVPGAAQGSQRVKPRLKGNGDFAVQGADFDLSDIAKQSNVSSWQLRIVDAQGNVVKQFSGQGKPPKSLSWQGGSDLGKTVDSGLGDSYEIRVQDNSGKTSVSSDDLVSQDSFAQAAQSAEAAAQGSSGAALNLKHLQRLDDGSYACSLHFEAGSAALSDDSYAALDELAKLLASKHGGTVEIRGYSAKDEGASPLQLSQLRAQNVLKSVVEANELFLDNVTGKGYGGSSKGSVVEIHVEIH